MKRLISLAALSVAGLTTTGLIAFQSTSAAALDDRSSGSDRDDSGAVFKRDDSADQVVTTTDDDDDDDDTGGRDDTRTRTNGADTNTSGTNTRTGRGVNDNSRDQRVKDFTNDGRGDNNVDRSRNHTNDRSRHNTRG